MTGPISLYIACAGLAAGALPATAIAAPDAAGKTQASPDGLAAATDPSADQPTDQPTDQAAGQPGGLQVELATGADYSVGHYGASTDTSVWSIPVDLKVQWQRLRVQASLPYEFVSGPGQVVGGVVISAPGSTTTHRSGVGDLVLTGAYAVLREHGALPMVELSANVKLATARSDIGTGQTDYGVSANLYKTLLPHLMAFGSVGYSWLGSPAAYTLQNGVVASAGLNYRPAPNQNYGFSFAYRDPVLAGLQGQAIVSPYMTYRFARAWGVTLYAMGGLNSASPRVGGGLRLSFYR